LAPRYARPVSFRDDGDALLARNDALEQENAKLKAENDALKAPPQQALVRQTPRQLQVVGESWWKKGFAVFVWIVAIAVAIWQGVL
jgi:hypothetical protein